MTGRPSQSWPVTWMRASHDITFILPAHMSLMYTREWSEISPLLRGKKLFQYVCGLEQILTWYEEQKLQTFMGNHTRTFLSAASSYYICWQCTTRRKFDTGVRKVFLKSVSFAVYNGVSVDEFVFEKLQRTRRCRGYSKLLSKERSTLINMRRRNSFRVVTSLWQFAPSLQLYDNTTLACSQMLHWCYLMASRSQKDWVMGKSILLRDRPTSCFKVWFDI